MKIKLSKSQWESVGKKSGWMKKAQEEITPTPFVECMLDLSNCKDKKAFGVALSDICKRFGVKFDIITKTLDV